MSSKRLSPKNLKLTVVGDKRVGKTALLKTYARGVYPGDEYVSTIFPYCTNEDFVYSKSINYSGAPLLLAMWDRVYSQKEDDYLRSLQYEHTDVFLLCFSLVEKKTLENVLTTYKREIQKRGPKTSCLLIGLKKDLRCQKEFEKLQVVTKSMGTDMSERIGAIAYLECSSKTKDNIKEVFSAAVQTAMKDLSSSRQQQQHSALCDSRIGRLVRLL